MQELLMHEDVRAALPNPGFHAELDWEGMDELSVTAGSQELSCSEDMQTERAPGIFPQFLLYGCLWPGSLQLANSLLCGGAS